ncbi:MAG: hypothetical protein ACI8PZ_003834 [Myxococcota bacterium]|jgi:hypothetical protein
MQDFLAEVEPLDARDRVKRCVDLGVRARADPDARAVVEALATSDPYARALAVRTTYRSRDAALLRRLCADPHATVRRTAQAAAVRLRPDADLPPLAALPAPDDRARMAARLARHGRHAPIDAWLRAQPERSEPEVLALYAAT